MKVNKSSKLSEIASPSIDNLPEQDRDWLDQQSPDVSADIQHALSFSDFLFAACQTQPGLMASLNSQQLPPEDYASQLQQVLLACETETAFLTCLRQFRQWHMAHITYVDCLSQQTIQQSLLQVSALADALIMGAYEWLYQHFEQKYGTPANSQPLCIIAMGKLGGGELNFSSDIDLIFAYPHKGETSGGRKPIEHQVFFTRLAQKLIHALDHVTNDGQVFRVDMRLRPFGQSGPLVLHFDAFADYYQEQAREWERFAMLKARVLNKPNEYTEQLESVIHPFVYKRYLDFTTLDALRDMKLKIFADSRRQQLKNNIKLGEGGIREAEFFLQTFQLIHGGQSVLMREKNWMKALQNAVNEQFLPNDGIDSLRSAYLFLREVEHGLQQINNAQTQTLPAEENSLDWERLVFYTQSETKGSLVDRIQHARADVNQFFNQLFRDEEEATGQDDSQLLELETLWLSDAEQEELAISLATQFTKEDTSKLASILLAFKTKVSQAHLSQRAQQRVDKLIPLLLLDKVHHPHCNTEGFERILAIVSAILGRTTYLDLLYEYPHVREQLVAFCAQSPWLSEQLQRFPLLLDELLSRAYIEQQTLDLAHCHKEYSDELRQALLRVDPDDVEQHMDILRQFKLCQQFRIAAADLHGSLPVEKVSDKLTVLAEVILEQVIRTAYMHMTQRYGQPDHSDSPLDSFAAIAYGKMGGYELGYGSDLDLVFIHNAPQNASTQGKKSVSAQQFYIKVAQRAMHILNTNTLLGALYEADLRLRPAGNAGLLCCHISGFEHYQENEAWTWEHQALVRARVVFGETRLATNIQQIRKTTLQKHRELTALQTDVVDMRKKLLSLSESDKDKSNFKHGVGGITDIEFLSQYWVLAYSGEEEALIEWPDNLRIIDVAQRKGLVSDTDASRLIDAYLKQRNAQHHSMLLENNDISEDEELAKLRKNTYACWTAILPPYTH